MSDTYFQSGLGSGATTSANTAEYCYTTSNGYGSTSTVIRKFLNVTTSIDPSSLITVSNSATLGLVITANRKCRIHINYTDQANQVNWLGITRNENQLTTAMLNITNSSQVIARSASSGANVVGSVSVWTVAQINDIFRPHTDGDVAGSTTSDTFIYIFAEEIT